MRKTLFYIGLLSILILAGCSKPEVTTKCPDGNTYLGISEYECPEFCDTIGVVCEDNEGKHFDDHTYLFCEGRQVSYRGYLCDNNKCVQTTKYNMICNQPTDCIESSPGRAGCGIE